MNILESYKRLNPGAQRSVLVGGILAGVLALSAVFMSFVEREAAQRPRAEKPEVTVVSPTRMTGVEQFSSEMVKGLRAKTMEQFSRKYIDDCDMLLSMSGELRPLPEPPAETGLIPIPSQ